MRALPIVLLAVSAGCTRGPAQVRSAVLVTFDTTRADALGCYGGKPDVTPNLDVLARAGVLYEAAHTVAPLTMPAHSALLTGVYPPRLGVRDNGVAALPAAAETLAERARAAGLQTGAFVSSVVLDPAFGLDQGFDVYDAPARPVVQQGSSYAEREGHATVARAIDWLAHRDRSRGFFLWVHLWDPHRPYRPAPAFRERAHGNDYLAEVATADDAFGALMLALAREGVAKETLIVAVADHGEAFGEHDELSHGAYVWETTLHVPLIVRRPGEPHPGRRVAAPVSAVDVAPTIAAALGLPPAAEEDGESLLEGAPAPRDGLYFESCYGYGNYGWSPLYGWLTDGAKLIAAPRARLYAWRADPREERDLAGERGTDVERMLDEAAEVAAREPLPRDAGKGPGADVRAGIAALGYGALADAAERPPGPRELAGLPDPMERTQEQLDAQKAMGALDAGELDEAHALFTKLLAANPGNAYARERDAIALIRAGRRAEAIAPLRALLAEHPAHADAWCQLGGCLLDAGKHEEALDAFRRALAIDANHAQALLGAASALETLGRPTEAAPLRARLERVQRR